jgi:hypothetical protein
MANSGQRQRRKGGQSQKPKETTVLVRTPRRSLAVDQKRAIAWEMERISDRDLISALSRYGLWLGDLPPIADAEEAEEQGEEAPETDLDSFTQDDEEEQEPIDRALLFEEDERAREADRPDVVVDDLRGSDGKARFHIYSGGADVLLRMNRTDPIGYEQRKHRSVRIDTLQRIVAYLVAKQPQAFREGALPIPIDRNELYEKVFRPLCPAEHAEEAYRKDIDNRMSNYLALATVRMPSGSVLPLEDTFFAHAKDDLTDRLLLTVLARQFQTELEEEPLPDKVLWNAVNQLREKQNEPRITLKALEAARRQRARLRSCTERSQRWTGLRKRTSAEQRRRAMYPSRYSEGDLQTERETAALRRDLFDLVFVTPDGEEVVAAWLRELRRLLVQIGDPGTGQSAPEPALCWLEVVEARLGLRSGDDGDGR